MVRSEPISPEKPEESVESKFELVKAMGVAIAAIAKEKTVFITTAEVQRNSNDYWELEIRCIVPKDKEIGDKYNKELRDYWQAHKEWETEVYREKFNISEEQYKQTETEYMQYCRETSYSERMSKERFFESKHSVFVSPIIEVP